MAPATPAPEAPRAGGLVDTLLQLAATALEAGDLATAEDRYERLLGRDPRLTAAHVGLARVAMARGDAPAAERWLRQAVTANPGAVDAWVGLAELAGDDPGRARELLDRALALDPDHPGANARLAERTGTAPHPARSLDEALAFVSQHPYDPAARVDAGNQLVAAGRKGEASAMLETALTLAERAPRAGAEAMDRLRALDPAWAERRVVPVYLYADPTVAARPGWRFRHRALWREISDALEPALGTRFVVFGANAFGDVPAGTPLASILDVLAARTGSLPKGIAVALRGEPEPERAQRVLGVARFLGRHMVVRDLGGDRVLRVLAHELLHLYGGVHVVDDIESLLNPDGDAFVVDALNTRIASVMADRAFRGGGFEADVLERVDVEAAAAAYRRVLSVNLAFRNRGLDALLGGAKTLGPRASRALDDALRTDDHLGDVSLYASRFLWASGERVEAVRLMEAAGELYGPRSPRGRMAFASADRLRERLAREYGVR